MTLHDFLSGIDWTAAATIIALLTVAASFYALRLQFREQKLLTVKKVEEEHLLAILRVSDRLHYSVTSNVARMERARARRERTETETAVREIEALFGEYRQTLLMSLHVVREIRRHRFPAGVTDVPLEELEGLTRDALSRNAAFVEKIIQIIEFAEPWDVAAADMGNASGDDFMLRIPIAEMLARMYVPNGREWKRSRRR